MNSIGYTDILKPQPSLTDPFNYPMPNRSKLMSMNTITPENDYVQTKTHRFITSRRSSLNNTSNDIEGNFIFLANCE